jgi:hypothetical protein
MHDRLADFRRRARKDDAPKARATMRPGVQDIPPEGLDDGAVARFAGLLESSTDLIRVHHAVPRAANMAATVTY